MKKTTSNNTLDNAEQETKGILGNYGKYRTLVLMIIAFLILTITLALLTAYSSKRFALATDELEIITRQGLTSYAMTENLMEIHSTIAQGLPNPNAAEQPNAIASNSATNTILVKNLPELTQEQLNDLSELVLVFDSTVNALQSGGDVQFQDGTVIYTDGLTSPELLSTVEKISDSWHTYRTPFQDFINQSQSGHIQHATLNQLVQYVRAHSGEINSDIANMRQGLNNVIQKQASLVTMIQIIGVVIAFLMFLAIVFGALRRLRQSDEQLASAQRQTDDIMRTINEGLFLIDKDLIIADKYSGQLEEIMQQSNLAGRSLYDVLRSMVSQKDMGTLKLFIDQLYNPWVVEDLIKDLNPLQQVLVSYIDNKQISHTKFLKFNFLRVLDKDQETIKNVFVSVMDITNEVFLQNQLEKDKEQHSRQIEAISYILTVDHQQLNRFLAETKKRIERMNNILKIHNMDNLSHKVQQLYRDTHSLKGDASAMKLSNVVDIAEKQEDLLKKLSDKYDLKGNDFLPFTVGLDELISVIAFIEDLTRRLNLSDGGTPLKSYFTDSNQSANRQNSQDAYHQNSHHNHQNQTQSQYHDGFFIDMSDDHQPNHSHQATQNTHTWSSFFTNYAHDIATRQGKQVSLNVQGFELLDDKPELSANCKDMTIQLLKNAIVHGIETQESRIAHHKDPVGQIHLSLLPNGDDSYLLQVRDDGQGIDWEKLRQKAIEQGLVSMQNAQELTRQDLLKFMFSSGISTADQQDEDAGRGIGMDIVHQIVIDLNGKINVNSQKNQFTDISITFPVSNI